MSATEKRPRRSAVRAEDRGTGKESPVTAIAMARHAATDGMPNYRWSARYEDMGIAMVLPGSGSR